MQVQRVQNNNNYNANFGAKLQLRGAVEDLPKELIKEFETFTKSIGKNNDIVDIDIGGVSEITQTWSDMGHRMEMTDYIKQEVKIELPVFYFSTVFIKSLF